MRQLTEIRKEISLVNSTLRSVANKKKSTTKKFLLRRQRRKLVKEFVATQRSIANSEKTFYVDSFSQSVLSLKCHKSRYLRNSKGYYNSENYLIAKNFHSLQCVILKTKSNNITERDLSKISLTIQRLFGNEFRLVTDNRHRVSQTLPKRYTMQIEREISKIKKPIYRQLKNFTVSKMEIQQLREIYETQFRVLGYSYFPLA